MTDALVLDQPSALPPSASAIADEAQSVLYQLRERLAEAERAVAAIPAKREALAFKASQGNQRAKRSLAEVADQDADARRECEDLRLAITEARRRLESARVAERAERDEASLAEAQRLRAEFIKESEKFDLALLAIGQAHKRRSELRRAIVGTGCIDIDDIPKLDCWIRVRLAVANAGVFALLCPGINAPSTDSRISLAASDRRTLSDLAPRATRSR